MTDILFRMSAIISMFLFAGLFLYAAVKFFRIWRNTREESLFHLGVLSLGMILYFFIILIMIGFSDPDNAIFLIKRVIGITYSILSLEMSLFYITAYINRRSLWEKYIPFIFGITTGTSLAVFGMNETDPWFPLLSAIAYITPMILITILVIRITIRSYYLLKEDQLTPEDKGFIKALIGTAIILFIGAIGDLSFFWLFVFIGPDIWSSIITLSGIISPLIFILSIFLIRTVFLNIEEADIVHLMNLLS